MRFYAVSTFMFSHFPLPLFLYASPFPKYSTHLHVASDETNIFALQASDIFQKLNNISKMVLICKI